MCIPSKNQRFHCSVKRVKKAEAKFGSVLNVIQKSLNFTLKIKGSFDKYPLNIYYSWIIVVGTENGTMVKAGVILSSGIMKFRRKDIQQTRVLELVSATASADRRS
jgi:hypothetical protein